MIRSLNYNFKGTSFGGTYPLAHFLGNFREKTKKVPTRTVSRKLPEKSGNFSDSRKFLKSPVTTRTL